jgi:hypothetical protein
MKAASSPPRCIVIAGPNGAGKTTFAREFLPKDARVVHFVNADLIAGGLSPLQPEAAAVTAGRIFLAELDRLARGRMDFAFETTLSGLVYRARLKRWKAAGIASKWCSCGWRRPDFLCGASRRACSRAGTMSHGRTCYAGSRAGGRILKPTTVRWRMPGWCMITPGKDPGC